MNMKRIGMIGGCGPESTLDYYRLLIDGYRQARGEGSLPEILIYSLDVYALIRFVEEKRWDDLTDYLLNGIHILARAGADFGFISANTPHIVFDRLVGLSPIKLISIVEETRKNAKSIGLKKVGLLGTSFTMQADFYQKEFAKDHISIVVPTAPEQDYIQHKLMTEIELGIFNDVTREGLLAIVQRMIAEDAIEGLILGCTELPLILTKDEFGIPFLNTTKIHADSVLNYCLTGL